MVASFILTSEERSAMLTGAEAIELLIKTSNSLSDTQAEIAGDILRELDVNDVALAQYVNELRGLATSGKTKDHS